MTTVVVYDREGNIQLKMRVFDGESILDIKQRMSEEDPSLLFMTCGGVPLRDTIPVSVLGESVVLHVDRDIEFTAINSRVDRKIDARQLCETSGERAKDITESTASSAYELSAEVGPKGAPHASALNDAFVLNGKTYAIINRRRRVTRGLLVEQLRRLMTQENAARLAVGLFLLTSNNVFLLLALFVFHAMVRLDRLLVTRRGLVRKFTDFVPRAVFMFFASMFFIDHSRYFD